MSYRLDDFSNPEQSSFGTCWLLFSDQSLGGNSQAEAHYSQNPDVVKLTGTLSPDFESCFVQWVLPLVHSRYLFDAKHFQGVYLTYRLPEHTRLFLTLRSRELSMPWQHYRVELPTQSESIEQRFELTAFRPFGTEHSLNPERISRIGLMTEADSPETVEKQAFEFELTEIGFY